MEEVGMDESPPAIEWKTTLDRNSHLEFFENRNWKAIDEFYSNLMCITNKDHFPTFIYDGETEYSLTNLQSIHDIGQIEFNSNDPRYRRKTFACVIGYHGIYYSGYQQQKIHNNSDDDQPVVQIRTVEDDLDEALQRKVSAAGRTDKNVSAINQVISFTTFENITEEQIMQQIRDSKACQDGRLQIYDCARVPKKFHALFSATYRRYLYFFPLNEGRYDHGVDVDVEFINRCLEKLRGKELPYNGFAHRDNREKDHGMKDLCILYKAQATLIDLNCNFNGDKRQKISHGETTKAVCIELVGSRFLRRMVRLITGTVIRESVLEDHARDEYILHKIAVSSDRSHASLSVPGNGLCLAGVGYDLQDLQKYKHGPSENIPSKHEIKDDEYHNSSEGNQIETENFLHKIEKKDKLNRRQRKHQLKQLTNQLITQQKILSQQNQGYLNCFDPLGLREEIVLDEQESNPVLSELITFDESLLFYPQRNFEFNSQTECSFSLLLDHDHSSVGTTIWDAEVLLSHYLFDYFQTFASEITDSFAMIELGAGTALASIVMSHILNRMVVETSIIVQELSDELLDIAKGNFLRNNYSLQSSEHRVNFVKGRWGEEHCINAMQSAIVCGRSGKADLIVMADVLYHEEDFESLLETVKSMLISEKGQLILVFEHRRKDLSLFLERLIKMFASYKLIVFRNRRNSTIFSLYHLRNPL